MEYKQPSIYIGDVRMDEPVTVITDLLVSAVCLYAFIMLSRLKTESKMHFYLKYYFLTMAIATGVGGLIGHGFLYAFERRIDISLEVSPWKLPAWLISMFSIMLIERAAIEYARPVINRQIGKFFSWLNIVEFITFVVITFTTLNFFFVQAHAAYGLLIVVAGFSVYVFWKQRTRGSKIFLVAVSIAAISALIFLNKWGISKWFTHFDISHVLMTISAWFFYRGGKQILIDPVLIEEK
jgi:hypothetical protein